MDRKKVLVTGAGRGIGRAIALAAAKAGYEVIAHYNRSSNPAAELKAGIEASGGVCSLFGFCVDVKKNGLAGIGPGLERIHNLHSLVRIDIIVPG